SVLLDPFIVDAHEDIAYNALHHGRDVRHSVVETRRLEREQPAAEQDPLTGPSETAMLGLPEHRRGGVGLVFTTIFVPPGAPEAMTADGRAQLRYYQHLADQDIGVRLITSRSELELLRRGWEAAPTPEARPVGFVLLMEGADPLRDAGDLEEWYREGL